jgi:cytochrome c oxidase cbb3-type subunit 1
MEGMDAHRFLKAGLGLLLALGILGAFASMPGISGALNLTGFTEAGFQLGILGAVSFPLFALIYGLLPGFLARECWVPRLTDRHFALTLTGLGLLVVSLLLGGVFTGLALDDSTVTFLNIASYTYPFHVLECVAWLILLVASLLVGANLTVALAAGYLFPKTRP